MSPNPLNRNPSYEPILNPDQALRTGDIQYVVWDTFSASRAPGFSDRLLGYAERYDARAVHVETLPMTTARRPHRQEAGDRRLRGAAVSRRVVLRVLALAAHWLGPASAQAAAAEVPPATPIRHFVVLMQENHSFDNYFGTYPGADGIPAGACMPIHPSRGRRPCVRPFRLGDRAGPDLPHDAVHPPRPGARRPHGRLHQRRLAGQAAPRVGGHGPLRRARPALLLERRRRVRALRQMVRVLARRQRAQPAVLGGGLARRSRATIFDRLERRGISWKFYVEDYDPSQRRRAGAPPATSKQAVRVPLLNMPRFVHRPRLLRHIVDLDQYYDDLRNGTLPQVAYIAPAGGSEHPPRRPETGQTLVRSLVTALARSTLWPHSAFLWTYDEWGGWYDHVPPPAGRGFRVPALLVSPYARKGRGGRHHPRARVGPQVHRAQLGVAPAVAPRRPGERHHERVRLRGSPARAAEIVPATRAPDRDREPRRWVIYLWYGAALVLAVRADPPGRPAARRGDAARRPGDRPRSSGPGPAPAQAADRVPTVIQTNPPTPGMTFSVDGVRFVADAGGRAYPPSDAVGTRRRVRALATRIDAGTRARFDRWYGRGSVAALDLDHRVGLRFVDLAGRRVDPDVVDSVTLLGSNGERRTFRGADVRLASGQPGGARRPAAGGPRLSRMPPSG